MATTILSALAILMVSAMTGCTPSQPAGTTFAGTSDFPWAAKPVAAGASATPDADKSRLPLPTDLGVAWDQVAHRSDTRWICRATPSGKVVMTSLCDGGAKVDTRWPGLAAPENWDGMVHAD